MQFFGTGSDQQNESESPKGIGWINDYYGHEGTAWAETHLRSLAVAWRAFPWGKGEASQGRSLVLEPFQARTLLCKPQQELR